MKPTSHDPLDDLIAAALHGDLTPAERTQFEIRLAGDSAARAAYQEAQLMHDLLEKTHASAQPDPGFEQRMVSGVRRKITAAQRPPESAWQSLVILWAIPLRLFRAHRIAGFATMIGIVVVLAGVAMIPITGGYRKVYTPGVGYAYLSPTTQKAGSMYLYGGVLQGNGQLTTSGVFNYSGVISGNNRLTYSPGQSSSVTWGNDSSLAYLAPGTAAGAAPAFNNGVGTATSGAFRLNNVTLAGTLTGQNVPQIISVTGNAGPVQPNGQVGTPTTGTLTSGNIGLAAGNTVTVEGGETSATIPIKVFSGNNTYTGAPTATAGSLFVDGTTSGKGSYTVAPVVSTNNGQAVTTSGPTDHPVNIQGFGSVVVASNGTVDAEASATPQAPAASATASNEPSVTTTPQGRAVFDKTLNPDDQVDRQTSADQLQAKAQDINGITILRQNGLTKTVDKVTVFPYPAPAAPAAAAPATNAAPSGVDTRKLIRNAQLELEVKSFQAAMDQITTLTRAAGGYVDSDNSQRGGNGKLQGVVVVKILPQNLDDFLLKLRDLGELKNQTISTDDVTREYIDLQARVDNSLRMEAQLQELLKRDYGKISDLLQVERELGRVRGEIEQMQGQLKLYDFQVAYATVTMQMREKDLNQAAAYLLKEQDNFSLLAVDVEAAFKQARGAADDFKAQVLTANLNHNSGSDISAQLDVMVPPDQIEPFLAQIRSLGRVSNFTRQTQRVARDGGDSDQPADQTLTEKDKVEVQVAINSDTASQKQAALTVVTPAVDVALDQAKSAALANAGTEILGSSLNKTQDGQSTAQLSVRVPGKSYRALLDTFRALGRTASFSLQRDDNSGPGASGDDEPVVLSLALTDDETPLQETQMAIYATDVDNQSQQLKQDAANVGVEIKASAFQRQPNGTEIAQMTFRLPMAKYAPFVESLKKLGKVESLTVNRNDRPDQTRADGTEPAQIDLTLYNQGDIVPEDNGLWATLRRTFGEGTGALLGSVTVIGVAIAFLIPWLVVLVILAWIGRRIYVWYKK